MKTAWLWEHDREQAQGLSVLAGIDEVGRGPLAGNVVAACVVLDLNKPIDGVRDSKKIPENKREDLYEEIMNSALYVGIGEASVEEIDRINILQATFLAMRRALDKLGATPELLLVDGNHKIPAISYKQRAIVKGDGTSANIAAASIVAKVTRDRQMHRLHEEFPDYGFDRHKGYGSKSHIQALLKHGLLHAHRKSFKPKALIQTEMFAERYNA